MNEDQLQNQYGKTSTGSDVGGESCSSGKQEASMNQEGAKKLTGKLKETWSSLNDEDIALYTAGKHDQFFDRLEEKHGVERDDAEEQVNDLKESCGCTSGKAA